MDSWFKLEERGTTVSTEIMAGITTFLTMVYIVIVNPAVLHIAGMDFDGVFMATILASALATLIMGIFANYPIAIAPGMGMNAYFSYSVVLAGGHSWQVALGAVFLTGIIFLLLSLTKFRYILIDSIPTSLKHAITKCKDCHCIARDISYSRKFGRTDYLNDNYRSCDLFDINGLSCAGSLICRHADYFRYRLL